MADPVEFTIESVGAKGDGVGVVDGASVFVPLALPGEVWRRNEAGDFDCVTPLADRASPPCRHFGVCGGCVAQHMPADLYAAWKQDAVRHAFQQQGIAIEPEPLLVVATGSRRRCVLTAQREDGEIRLGYHRMRSHDLVALEMCPILTDDITRAFEGFKKLVGLLLAGSGSVRLTVLSSDGGLDVDVGGDCRTLTPDLRRELATAVEAAGLARLTVDGDPIVQLNQPALTMADVAVPVPSGVFVQATAQSEAGMAALVADAARSSKRVADLFCGVGTFTYALARRSRVVALDSDRDALAALAAARDGASGLKPIEVRPRDLMREPLSRKELEPFDCVVFDPPRAGAEAQSKMLAKSQVPTVIAVSCNPATLARDARILIDGGYELQSIHPIDQFLFSAHVECVGVFRRPKAARRQRR